MAEIKWLLDGAPIDPPANWMDINIKSVWDSQIQPTIELDEHIFTNEQTEIIDHHLTTTGIFEGIKYIMQLAHDAELYQFDGIVDTTTLSIESPVKYKAKVKYLNDISTWNSKFEAISYGYMAERGMFNNSDYVKVPVIIHKKFDALEVTFAMFGVYMLTKEIIEHTKTSAASITRAAKIIISLSSAASEVLEAVATIVFNLAYYALMTIALKKFSDSINTNLIPRKVHYKGITLKKALDRACAYYNLVLVTDITDMERFVYIPSKTDDKAKTNIKDEGIPNASDYGYQVNEMFELVLTIFNARIDIQNGYCYIYNEDSNYWRAKSTNVMPSNIELESFSYNAHEMKANRLIHFQYDSSDDWTIPANNNKNDYTKGTNFQVITDFDTPKDEVYKLNKGLDEISLPLALGKRRDKLSALELALKAFFAVSDELISLFGGQTVGQKIDENKGCLHISSPAFDIAKLIYLDSSLKIPANHRDHLSGRALYDNYYSCKSFVSNAERTQHKDFKDIKIPFDFVTMLGYLNSPFFTFDNDGSAFSGKQGKMKEFSWNMAGDYAIASFYVEDKYVVNQLDDTGNKRIES
jgi:hypothetical protein